MDIVMQHPPASALSLAAFVLKAFN